MNSCYYIVIIYLEVNHKHTINHIFVGFHRAASKVGTTPIENIVGGEMINSVICRECQMVSNLC